MNQTINSIKAHRSIRDYVDQPISNEHLEAIVTSAQAAPSSINGQQMSIVVIKDQKKRDKIATLSGGQPWISNAPIFLLFVMDYYRTKIAADKNGETLVLTDNIESTLVASVDVGLALSHAMIAAESLGIGTVCIGGIRNNPQEIINLVELPEYTFPLVGLCLGYANEMTLPDLKPRFDKDAVIHDEIYNRNLHKAVSDYDDVIKNYMAKRSGDTQVHDWSGFVSSIYNRVYFPKVSPVLKSQKFKSE